MSRAKVGGLAVAAILVIVYGVAIATDENPGELAVVGAVALGVLAVYWWLAVLRPSARAEGNTPAIVSLVSGILAGATMILWWMGLPVVLGGGAVVLGLEGRDRAANGAGRGALAIVGLALGGLASLTWIVVALTD
ncbi:MAG: hypothetical protein ACREJL_05980 [Candidatus Methylomirabilales bacterium]